MKRKKYFTISCIVSILLTIYTFIFSGRIVEEQVESMRETLKNFGESLVNRAVLMLQNSGVFIIVFTGIFVILFNILILYYIKKDKLFKRKGSVIAFSLISIFLTESFLVQVICTANLIIMAFSDKEIDLEDKKKIPKVEYVKSTKKEKIFSIILLLCYFSQFIWGRFIPSDFNIYITCVIAFDIIIFTLCILIFYKTLKHDFILFKKNLKPYIKFALSRLGIGYLLFIVFNFIVLFITKNSTSVNQETLESLPKWYTIPTAIIFAPIAEEIIFRGVFRRFLNKNLLFIIISGTVFGLLHTLSENGIFNIIIMAIPYGVLGSTLAYIYSKSNNIWTNISCHALINIVASIFTLFI